MKLYIGGAYQGQEELARRENPGAEMIPDFHLQLKGFDGDPHAFAEDFCREHPDAVIIADEIGCGVVPIDRNDRIHGGTIMAIMEHFTNGQYYDFQAQNGKGFILNADGSYEVL